MNWDVFTLLQVPWAPLTKSRGGVYGGGALSPGSSWVALETTPRHAHAPGNAPGGGAGQPRMRSATAPRLRPAGPEGGGGLVCERMCEGREASRLSVVLRRARAGGGGGMRRGGGAGAGLVFGRARAADPGLAAAGARLSRTTRRRRTFLHPHFFFFFLNNRNQ
jgi:hypothetical protein